MKEQWKLVKGFEKQYKISNFGNLYSFLYKRTVGYLNSDGYFVFRLNKNRVTKFIGIHRLVALHFLKNPKKYKEVNHINGIKTDNNILNLEWCDRSRNCQHAYDTGLNPKCFGESNGRAKLKDSDILEILNLHKMGYTGVALSKMFKVNDNQISRILNGKNWKHITGGKHEHK